MRLNYSGILVSTHLLRVVPGPMCGVVGGVGVGGGGMVVEQKARRNNGGRGGVAERWGVGGWEREVTTTFEERIEYVNWCFAPSHPVWLYQGDTHFVIIYHFFKSKSSTETIRLIREGNKGTGGYGGELGGGRLYDYIPIVALSPPERLLH